MKKIARLPHGLIVALLFVAACGGGEEEPAVETGEPGAATETAPADGATAPGAAGEADAALVTQGQEVFTGPGICFTCHGQDATGTQLAPDLTDDEWLNIEQPVTVQKIVDLVRSGVQQPVAHPAPMPPMGGANLNDEQLTAVATYVHSLSQ